MKSVKHAIGLLNSTALGRPLFLMGTASALMGSGPALALDGGALPQGGSVAGGSATISQSGNTLNVNQSSNRAIIDWRSFNIGANAQANFSQPSSSAIAVNRVNGSANPSQIEGTLTANGQVWILNPNGVFFGKTAVVDAAGIVATTANIDDKAFMAGSNSLQMTGGDSGQVVNQGSITVGQSGLAAFVAPTVRNSGIIHATVGRVALAAGDTYTLDLAGDHLVEIGLGATKAVVDQSGKIVNPGGTIAITAKAASQVVDSVINMSGVTDASSVKTAGGDVILAADDITTTATSQIKADAGINGNGGSISAVANKTGDYAGSFSAKGGSASGDGGSIETSGQTVTVAADAKVNASAPNGKAGKWTLDPLNVTISAGSGGGLTGGTVTTGEIQSILASGTSVDITTDQSGTDAGDLTLAASINATSSNNAGLTLEGRHLSATGGSTISISGGALVLDVNTVNTMSSAPTSWVNDAIAMVGSVSGGTTINLGAATYTYSPTTPLATLGALITVNKSDLTLNGDGVQIDVDPAAVSGGQLDAISIAGTTTGVTIEDFDIQGELTSSYLTYDFGSDISRGVAVTTGATNFTIIDNRIENIRTGILVDGRNNTGSITNNLIDNTKSALSIQYTDGTGITVTGNSQGSTGNEWGEILHLNGYYDGTSVHSNPYPGGDAPAPVQTQLLADAAANNGWTVEDQAYTTSNRTAVTVGPTGSDSNQGSPLSQLATIQAGVNDVVAGGVVTIDAGIYTGTLDITKSVDIEGAGIGETIIQPTTLLNTGVGHKYDSDVQTAVFVNGANDVILNGLTIDANDLGANAVVFWNNASGTISNALIENPMALNGAQTGQGLAVDATTGNNTNLNVSNVTFQNWNKSAIDAVTGDGQTTGGGDITLSVTDSTFTGAGATGVTAQNGIVLWERGGGTVSGTVSGSTFTGIDYTGTVPDSTATGVLLYGSPNGSLTVENSAFTNVQTYISTAGGSPNEVDATDNNTFDGITVSAATPLEDLFAIENKIVDGTDDGTDGLVRLVAGQVYATAAKDNIQNAVDVASSGDTVNVQAGTYTEQVVIGQPVNLVGAGEGATIITAPITLTHSFTAEGSAQHAIISVENTSGVTVSSLTVDGQGNGSTNPDLIGVGFYDASGTVNGVRITDIRDGNGSLSGVQEGYGVGVYNDGGTNQIVTVENSQIDDFQKNGIAFRGENLTADILDNTITGAGDTANIAQNGIELYDNASGSQTITGTIQGNTVSGVSYLVTGSTPPDYAASIYLINTSSVLVNGNTITGTGNDAASSYGAAILGSSNVTLQGNVFQNLQRGISLYDSFYGSGGAYASFGPDSNITISSGSLSGNVTGLVTDASFVTGLSVTGVSFAGNSVQFTGSSAAVPGVFANNTFDSGAYVTGADTIFDSLQATVNSASAGSTINAEGSFGEDVAVDTQLLFDFDNAKVNSFTLASAAADSSLSGTLSATGAITLDGAANLAGSLSAASIALNGAATLTGNLTLDTSGANGAIAVASADGTTAGGQALTVKAGTGTASLGDLGANTALGAVSDTGAVTLTGATYDAASLNLGVVTLTGNTAFNANGAITLASADGTTAGGQSLSVTAGSASLGNLGANTALGAVSDTGAITLTGATYDTASLDLGVVTLTGNTTFNASGALTLASADGTTVGGQSLSVTAGSASLGNLGANTALGAVTDASATTLTGSTYNAASFNFDGAVTLTAATTSLNTAQSASAAGDITFGSNIFGTADGSQSLALAAGSGAASTNGNISLQDVGTSSIQLGSLTVSGNDFTALTVDIAGDFTSHLTGNQVFAADTLNAGGDVNSNVAGNASGHIVSSGDVAMNVDGGLSGSISATTLALTTGSISDATLTATQGATIATGDVSGTSITASTLVATAGNFDATVNAQNSANIQAATISGSYTGGTMSLTAAQSVNANISANTLNLSAPQGTVTGTWTQSTVTGSDLVVNSQSQFSNVNPQQLVVEGFALPLGTQISANGELILPAGTVIGLLSPGGGQPRLVLVHDVQSLGLLLSEGYAAIVIDLSGRKKDGLMQVSSN